MHKMFVYGLIIAAAAVFAFGFYLVAWALSGYDYSADIRLTNASSGSYNGRILVDTYPAALVDGGFIYQEDAEDVYFSGGRVTAMALADSGTQQWAFYAGPLAVGAHDYSMGYGSASAARDQAWIAAGSDTFTVGDHADLDVTTDFMLTASITLFDTPPAGTKWKIIDKAPNAGTPTGYQLVISATPCVEFNLWCAATSAAVSLPISLNTAYDIEAWYNGTDVVISDGSTVDTVPMTGTATVNSEDLEICEYAGLCDDIAIRGN